MRGEAPWECEEFQVKEAGVCSKCFEMLIRHYGVAFGEISIAHGISFDGAILALETFLKVVKGGGENAPPSEYFSGIRREVLLISEPTEGNKTKN